MNNSIVLIVIIILFILLAFVMAKQNETFTRGVPYYTTTFQAYPGKYMHFDSTRSSLCLQRNGTYSGFRNCMLYLA